MSVTPSITPSASWSRHWKMTALSCIIAQYKQKKTKQKPHHQMLNYCVTQMHLWCKMRQPRANINSLKNIINDMKMPQRSKKAYPIHSSDSGLNHRITLAPEGPAWVRHHTYLFSVRLKGKVCSHNMQPANNASVLRIMKSASGCWLCLTCKLSIGDAYKWLQTTWWNL